MPGLRPRRASLTLGAPHPGTKVKAPGSSTRSRARVAARQAIERGWLGGGNTGRNTTAIRSNYFYPESAALYDLGLRLYEGLSRELNYNLMVSQRGNLQLARAKSRMPCDIGISSWRGEFELMTV